MESVLQLTKACKPLNEYDFLESYNRYYPHHLTPLLANFYCRSTREVNRFKRKVEFRTLGNVKLWKLAIF
jgi:hypothetical protein